MSVGIKETSEALAGINEVAVLLCKQLKDGFQVFVDFEAFYANLMQNSDFRAKMLAAWENHQAIPAEISDLDLNEGVQLSLIQLGYLPRIAEALKKA